MTQLPNFRAATAATPLDELFDIVATIAENFVRPESAQTDLDAKWPEMGIRCKRQDWAA